MIEEECRRNLKSIKFYDLVGGMSGVANLNEQVIIEESDDQYIEDADLLLMRPSSKNYKMRNSVNLSI